MTDTDRSSRPQSAALQLPQHLDLTVCEDLSAQLMALRHTAVQISAAQVGFVGALALQLLLSAQRQWQADGAAFSVTDPSDAFREGTELLGFSEFPFKDVIAA
ncbi:STAS domain-containing protein [Seohaeicola saemankumensis]|nr:STAS domain-containing protein [Seohaeicola saemankumensis]MCA0872275.1 STAS domain-containing protein [Seohaeicola saemankumensis]